jgi:hypothetical protein
MRDLEKLLLALNKHGFTEYEHVEGLPHEEGDYVEPGFLLHGTTVESAASILDDGLLPRSNSMCEVWADDRMPGYIKDRAKISYLLECRQDNVYFWDKYATALEQAVGSVQYMGEGNPAILLMDMDGLDTELDPEINPEMPSHEDEEAIAFMHEGGVDKLRVRCVCFLKEEWLPTLGEVICEEHGSKNESCRWKDVETVMEDLGNTDNWDCRCRVNMKAPKQSLMDAF